MKKLYKQFQKLQENFDDINSLIKPISIHDDLKFLMKPNNIGPFKEEHPTCTMSLNLGGKMMYFPVCNRLGAKDPDMVSLVLKLVEKMSGKEEMQRHSGQLTILKAKLQGMLDNGEGTENHDMMPEDDGYGY